MKSRRWRGAIIGPYGAPRTGLWFLVLCGTLGGGLLLASVWHALDGHPYAWVVLLLSAVFLTVVSLMTAHPHLRTGETHLGIHLALGKSPQRVAYAELREVRRGRDASPSGGPGYVEITAGTDRVVLALCKPDAFLQEVWSRAPHTRPSA